MANNPACMSNDGAEAAFIGTFFDSGDSVTVCGDCLVGFCASIVKGITGLDVPGMLASGPPSAEDAHEVTGEPMEAAKGTDEQAADPTQPTGKTGRTRAASSGHRTATESARDEITDEAVVASSDS